MARADSKNSISMPVDPTRRRFLAVAAVASAVGAGTLAAATQTSDVPQAVTVPIGPDPIYAVIEQHRKAAREHLEAVRVQFAYEEHGGKQGERRQEYERLIALTDVAWAAMADAGCTLVNTPPDDAGRYPCALPVHRTAVRRDRSA
jgi:hypothetical protein